MEIRGTCEGCGKTYRVPSAEKAYKCKGCGGTVRVSSPPSSPNPDPASARRRSESTPSPGTKERRTERRARGSRRQKSNKGAWLAVGVTLVVGGIVAVVAKTTIVAATSGEPDLSKVVLDFDEAWNDGDVGDLVSMFHPQKSREFEERMEHIVDGRGWSQGFPTIEVSLAGHTGEIPANKRSVSQHALANGRVSCKWQYNEDNTTWYLFDLKLPYPEIASQLAAFEKDWERSSIEALAPYFAPGSAEKMGGVVTKLAKKHGWNGHPNLEVARPHPDPTSLDNSFFKKDVDTQYRFEGGGLTVRWKYHAQTDSWRISGFRVK